MRKPSKSNFTGIVHAAAYITPCATITQYFMTIGQMGLPGNA